MAILWCGGEDVDIRCGMGGWFDNVFSREGFHITYQTNTPQISPVTDVWISVICRLAQMQVYANSAVIGLVNLMDNGIVLRTVEQGDFVHLAIAKTDGSLLSTGSILFSANSTIKFDLQIINYGTSGTVNSYINGELNATYTGDLSPSVGDINIVKGCFWRCSMTHIGDDHTSISEIIIADEDTRLMRLKTLAPSATGDLSNWTGAYTDIDEVTLSDTDKIYSSTADADFQCNLTGMPSGQYTPLAVRISSRFANKNDSYGMQHGVKTNGSVYLSDIKQSPDYWGVASTQFDINPSTGLPWSSAEIEALQFSYRHKVL